MSKSAKIEIYDYIQDKNVKISEKTFNRFGGDEKKIAEMRLKDRNRHQENHVKTATINERIKANDTEGLKRFEKTRQNSFVRNKKKRKKAKKKENISVENMRGAWKQLLDRAIVLGYNFNADSFDYSSEQWHEIEDYITDTQLQAELEYMENFDSELLDEDYFDEYFEY